MHKCKAKIIPYVLTWDGIVTKFHKSYVKQIGLSKPVEAYIQYIVLKKTLESVSYDQRRGEDDVLVDGLEKTSAGGMEMWQPLQGKVEGAIRELSE